MNTQAKNSHDGLRDDLALISNWIPPGARVLDLGCGDGALLARFFFVQDPDGYQIEVLQRHGRYR